MEPVSIVAALWQALLAAGQAATATPAASAATGAVIGGTTSELSGGDFVEGAIPGALLGLGAGGGFESLVGKAGSGAAEGAVEAGVVEGATEAGTEAVAAEASKNAGTYVDDYIKGTAIPMASIDAVSEDPTTVGSLPSSPTARISLSPTMPSARRKSRLNNLL